jgi:hypothetical protein
MASAESSTFMTEDFPFVFDWADDVESDIQREREESHGWDLCHDYEEFTGDEASEIDYKEDVKYTTERDKDMDDDRTNIVSIPLTEEVSSRERMLLGIEEEFRGQENAMVHDEDIHHFNWLGSPVYQLSSTTPAESLAIMCCGPKVPKESDKWRIGSILDRAYQFLDPVVVSLERATQINFNFFSITEALAYKMQRKVTPSSSILPRVGGL